MRKSESNSSAVAESEQEAKPEQAVPAQLTLENVQRSSVDPFSKLVAFEDIFKHQQVDELQEIIRAAISQASMVLVSGPPGVGKTTAIRGVTDTLPPNRYTVVYIGQDQNGANLLRRFSEALGLGGRRLRQHVVLQLSQWLTNNVKDGGKSIVLIVDEAHLQDDQTLEELRLLSNADYDRQSSFTLILIAQPWLRARLKTPLLEPLAQRIRYRYSLEGLSKEDTVAYVRARLSTAGISPGLFSEEAIFQVFAYSEGIPRKVNNLCCQLLLKVQKLGLKEIDAGLVKRVADSMEV
jgi:type II secretory pathway predicted ATPase ExeA